MSDWWENRTEQELREIEQNWAKNYALRFVPKGSSLPKVSSLELEYQRYWADLGARRARFVEQQKKNAKLRKMRMARRHTKQVRGPDGRFVKEPKRWRNWLDAFSI